MISNWLQFLHFNWKIHTAHLDWLMALYSSLVSAVCLQLAAVWREQGNFCTTLANIIYTSQQMTLIMEAGKEGGCCNPNVSKLFIELWHNNELWPQQDVYTTEWISQVSKVKIVEWHFLFQDFSFLLVYHSHSHYFLSHFTINVT